MSTTVKQAVCLAVLNGVLRRRVAHLHFVHGGAIDLHSYGRKKWLNHMKLLQVGVSPFVKERLIAHDVREDRIRVAGNFMTRRSLDNIRRRAPFAGEMPMKGLVVSRLVPGKRVDVLLQALEQDPGLNELQFTIYGLGGQHKILQARAQAANLNVTLAGFSSELNQISADYDFLVHLCPDEPFGLVILEAMAAGLPVLVPNTGGVTMMVVDGETGFQFVANNADSLALALHQLIQSPAEALNAMVDRAAEALQARFSCEAQLDRYRQLIEEARN